MRNFSKIPFFQQLNKYFFALILLFLGALATFFLLYVQQNNQLAHFVDVQAPQLTAQLQYHQFLLENDTLIADLLIKPSVQEIVEVFEQTSKNLNQMVSLLPQQSQAISELLRENDQLDKTVARISQHDRHNGQLKQNVLIQLQLIIDSLTTAIEEAEAKRLVIYRQLSHERVSEAVTASRARAHIKLVESISENKQLVSRLDSVFVQFEMLNLGASSKAFEQVGDNIDLFLTNWSRRSPVQINNEDQHINEKVIQLEKLLFSEQRALAKWRGHLRLVEEFFSVLTRQTHQLRLLAKFEPLTAAELPTPIPLVLVTLVEKTGLTLAVNQYRLIYSLGLFLIVIVFISLTLKIRSRIKFYGLQSVSLCEQLLAKEENQQLINLSLENAQVFALIEQMRRPNHNEAEYQALVNLRLHESSVIAQHLQLAYWQYIPKHEYPHENKWVTAIIAGDDHPSAFDSWRRAFDHSSVVQLIKQAKIAKNTGEFQQLRISTRWGKTLSITLIYENNLWSGTIHNDEDYAKQVEKTARLQSELALCDDNYQKKCIAQGEHLQQMIIATMLQNQKNANGDDLAAIGVYKQLARMFSRNQQNIDHVEFKRGNLPVELQDVNFFDQLYTALYNASFEAHFQRNELFLHSDPQVLEQANINAVLLQRLLIAMVRLLLTEQTKAKLRVKLDVVDKNSGQQLIRFTFEVWPRKPENELPSLLAELLSVIDATHNEHDPIIYESVSYLKTLLNTLYCSNTTGLLNEQKYGIAFDMPVTIVAQNESTPALVNIKQINILVISSNPLVQKMVAISLKSANVEIETLTSAEYVDQSLSIKHLNRHRVDLVMLAEDCSQSDFEHINQHVRTLPKSLQPKLLVLQSLLGAPLHRQGLYSQANNPSFQRELQSQIHTLLNNDRHDNCLITPDKLNQYQYLPSPVEVLLAVSKVQHHQILIRLLHWLGLRVNVVCDAGAMLNQWRSGKYLVLFSEFKHSPFIKLTTGNLIKRAVISLSVNAFPQDDSEDTSLGNHWFSAMFNNPLDIQTLVTLLQPWLKTKSFTAITTREQPQRPTVTCAQTNIAPDSAVKAESLPMDDLSSAPSVHGHPVTSVLEQAFNMQQYAINQGSVELAFYMLDDYLSDIDRNVQQLQQAIFHKQTQKAKQSINILLNISRVLAADELHEVCENIARAIVNKADTDHLMEPLLIELTQKQASLVTFVEAL